MCFPEADAACGLGDLPFCRLLVGRHQYLLCHRLALLQLQFSISSAIQHGDYSTAAGKGAGSSLKWLALLHHR